MQWITILHHNLTSHGKTNDSVHPPRCSSHGTWSLHFYQWRSTQMNGSARIKHNARQLWRWMNPFRLSSWVSVLNQMNQKSRFGCLLVFLVLFINTFIYYLQKFKWHAEPNLPTQACKLRVLTRVSSLLTPRLSKPRTWGGEDDEISSVVSSAASNANFPKKERAEGETLFNGSHSRGIRLIINLVRCLHSSLRKNDTPYFIDFSNFYFF